MPESIIQKQEPKPNLRAQLTSTRESLSLEDLGKLGERWERGTLVEVGGSGYGGHGDFELYFPGMRYTGGWSGEVRLMEVNRDGRKGARIEHKDKNGNVATVVDIRWKHPIGWEYSYFDPEKGAIVTKELEGQGVLISSNCDIKTQGKEFEVKNGLIKRLW